MAKNKVYKVVAKYEFEMVGQKKEQVIGDLAVLFDTLVECHSNIHTGNDADWHENFTGKYPKRISCVATLSKATRQLNPKKYKEQSMAAKKYWQNRLVVAVGLVGGYSCFIHWLFPIPVLTALFVIVVLPTAIRWVLIGDEHKE